MNTCVGVIYSAFFHILTSLFYFISCHDTLHISAAQLPINTFATMVLVFYSQVRKFHFSSSLNFKIQTYFQSLIGLTLQMAHWSSKTRPPIPQGLQHSISFCFKISKSLALSIYDKMIKFLSQLLTYSSSYSHSQVYFEQIILTNLQATNLYHAKQQVHLT